MCFTEAIINLVGPALPLLHGWMFNSLIYYLWLIIRTDIKYPGRLEHLSNANITVFLADVNLKHLSREEL